MPMFFPRTAFPRGCIVPCTTRHGVHLMESIMDSTGAMIGILCQDPTATHLCKFGVISLDTSLDLIDRKCGLSLNQFARSRAFFS